MAQNTAIKVNETSRSAVGRDGVLDIAARLFREQGYGSVSLRKIAEAAGIKARRLPVASAFHSPIVAGAVDPFRKALDKVEFAKARFPVYANVSAKRYPLAYAKQRDVLSTQIESPVRFRSIIEAMAEDGVTTFVEAGPGTVLTALVGQILPGKANAVALDDRKGDGLAAFLAGLGRLAVLGHKVDFKALFANMPPPQPRAATR